MPVADKIMLTKRAIIESVNDELKNIALRHHSFTNLFTNALRALVLTVPT